jgi:hypothetical protein
MSRAFKKRLVIAVCALFALLVLMCAGEMSYSDAVQQESKNCEMYPQAFSYCSGVQVGNVERMK